MRRRDHQVLEGILRTRGGLGHREHLEVAWSYLRLYSNDTAFEVMVEAIRGVARVHRAEHRYHETMPRGITLVGLASPPAHIILDALWRRDNEPPAVRRFIDTARRASAERAWI